MGNIANFAEYRYVALFLAALAEGPIVVFAAGSMVALGHLNLYTTLGVLFARDIVLDTAFYGLGRLVSIPTFAMRVDKIRKNTGLANRILSSIEHCWSEHPVRLMWIGKFAYGLSAWFLVSAGVARLSFRKFYICMLPVSAFQFGILLTLGYFMGSAMHEMKGWIFWVQIVIAALASFIVMQMLARIIRKKYLR